MESNDVETVPIQQLAAVVEKARAAGKYCVIWDK